MISLDILIFEYLFINKYSKIKINMILLHVLGRHFDLDLVPFQVKYEADVSPGVAELPWPTLPSLSKIVSCSNQSTDWCTFGYGVHLIGRCLAVSPLAL